MEARGELYVSVPLLPRKKKTWYQLNRGLGEPQS